MFTMPKPLSAYSWTSVAATATGVTLDQPKSRAPSGVNAGPKTVTSAPGMPWFGYTV